jgi:hypothetical protein
VAKLVETDPDPDVRATAAEVGESDRG